MGTPRSKADEESYSVKDFLIALFAYPEAKLSRIRSPELDTNRCR